MKRFVTYLYECDRGSKSKNMGFIRVNVRGSETSMEIYLRNYQKEKDEGMLYVLMQETGLRGMALGEIKVEQGQSDERISFATEDIAGSKIGLKNIEGIAIRFKSGAYVASCWKDDYADEIVRGDFHIWNSLETNPKQEIVVAEKEDGIYYEKIDISQIRDLPSPNWHFATNSFLLHGFWNYGYLVLKKVLEAGKETCSLGVPGVFEKPEAVMAVLFGFPSFSKVPKEMEMTSLNEKNQEAEEGTFGCWFVTLRE